MAALDRPVVKPRPVYLDLFAIRQPLAAVVSILHRISGALLFLVGIPVLLWGVQASLASPDAFAALQGRWPRIRSASSWLIGLIWAYMHHFFAGVRFLLLDLHVGDDLKPARQSAVRSCSR